MIGNMADFTKDIIGFVQAEKQKYEDASQDIRELIKKSRQYYMSKFEKDTDSSGMEKTFVPMTRWEVDTMASKIFVNDKAVTVLPENEKAVKAAFIAEKTLKYQVNEVRFPTYFRNSLFDLGRDGTTVWAIYWDFKREIVEEKGIKASIKKLIGKAPKPKVNVLKDRIGMKQVDLLNCYIDPTADSIQDAPSFAVKIVMPLDEVRRNKLYSNTEHIKGIKITKTDAYDATSTMKYDIGRDTIEQEIDMCELYQRWGYFPKSWLTGKKKDEGQMINGVIDIAGIDDSPIVLRVDINPFEHGLKPFEECWAQKVKGRWYGIGAAEKIIPLQKYLNKTVNRAIKNEDVLHSGLWKKKRGSGISTRSITSTPGGVIEVDNMDDLEQLKVDDVARMADPTIQRILTFTERINGANEISTGSAADRSATTSLIKDRNADTRFAVVRGNINDFLKRFFKQWLALDRQFLDKKFVLRVTGEDTDLEEIDAVLGLPQNISEKMQYRFIEVEPDTIRNDFDLEVDIDQSIPMNKAENAQRLLQAIQMGVQMGIPKDYSKLYDAYLDMIGLTGMKYKTQKQLPMNVEQQMGLQNQQAQQQMNEMQMANEMNQFQEANVEPMVGTTQEIPRNAVGLMQ